MELIKTLMIDRVPVEQFAQFNGLIIYSEIKDSESMDGGEKLFFTKGGKVIQILIIEADCGQNMWYVSEVKFSSPGGE